MTFKRPWIKNIFISLIKFTDCVKGSHAVLLLTFVCRSLKWGHWAIPGPCWLELYDQIHPDGNVQSLQCGPSQSRTETCRHTAELMRTVVTQEWTKELKNILFCCNKLQKQNFYFIFLLLLLTQWRISIVWDNSDI